MPSSPLKEELVEDTVCPCAGELKGLQGVGDVLGLKSWGLGWEWRFERPSARATGQGEGERGRGREGKPVREERECEGGERREGNHDAGTGSDSWRR